MDDVTFSILHALTGIRDIYLEQTKAFGKVNRFPSKRVVTVVYQALLGIEKTLLSPGYAADYAKWFTLREVPQLPYDHNKILSYTIDQLQKNKAGTYRLQHAAGEIYLTATTKAI